MPALYALYLSRAAHENLDIGLAEGRWGLTDDAVARHLGQLHPPRSGLDLLKELQVGDLVLAASGGPQPRVKRGGWVGATLREGLLWRVTRPYFHDTSKPWPAPPNKPNESYPHRFGIEEVETVTNVTRATIADVGMDAMHYSANIGGLPVPVVQGAPIIATVGAPAPDESEDPGFLILGGELDATVLTSVRREQRKLRAKLLGQGTTGTCALCGRVVPTDCLRTAHVKRRSICTEHERLDLANIMIACTLGCDHLFELGYVYIDPKGVVRPRASAAATPELNDAIERIAGRICAAHSSASEPFFAAHREAVSA
jgi:hypothetical protein